MNYIKSCGGFGYGTNSVRRWCCCCWCCCCSSIEFGILNRKDDDGVEVKERYAVDAYGLGYDDIVELRVPSIDGFVRSNIDLNSWRFER